MSRLGAWVEVGGSTPSRHANTKSIKATLVEGQIKKRTVEVYNGLIRMDNDSTQTNNEH
jgi:hypothetical protein